MCGKMTEPKKTINGDVPHRQVRNFAMCIYKITHINEFTDNMVREATEELREVHGLQDPEIYYLVHGRY